MTNRLELNWNLDGFVEEQRYYCSETPIDPLNLPPPKAILAGNAHDYVDTDIENGKKYYIRVGSVKATNEKISSEVEVLAATPWNPINSSNVKMLLDADTLTNGTIISWTCSKTNEVFARIPNDSFYTENPVVSDVNGKKTALFSSKSSLSAQANGILENLIKNTSHAFVFVVFKKNITDSTSKSRRIFAATTGVSASMARFVIYADDAVSGNVNRITVGGRRLDSNSYVSLSTAANVDLNLHFICGEVNHLASKYLLTLDGGVTLEKATSQGSGLFDNSKALDFAIGGGSDGFVGHIAAVIVGNSQLSNSDRQKMEGWAAHKYGLTDNLPTNHPYKILVPTL